jgi:hypothetical protein
VLAARWLQGGGGGKKTNSGVKVKRLYTQGRRKNCVLRTADPHSREGTHTHLDAVKVPVVEAVHGARWPVAAPQVLELHNDSPHHGARGHNAGARGAHPWAQGHMQHWMSGGTPGGRPRACIRTWKRGRMGARARTTPAARHNHARFTCLRQQPRSPSPKSLSFAIRSGSASGHKRAPRK